MSRTRIAYQDDAEIARVAASITASHGEAEWRRIRLDLNGPALLVPADLVSAVTAVDTSASKAELRAHAAARRYAVETGGCAWGAHAIQTDRDSQAKLMAEFIAIGAGLRADPSPWKMAGGFVSLSNADMLSAVAAARDHIAGAFATEATVVAAIEAGTVTTPSQVDAAFA